MEKSTMYKLLISLRMCLLFFIKISFGCRHFISIKLMEEVLVWHLKVKTVCTIKCTLLYSERDSVELNGLFQGHGWLPLE